VWLADHRCGTGADDTRLLRYGSPAGSRVTAVARDLEIQGSPTTRPRGVNSPRELFPVSHWVVAWPLFGILFHQSSRTLTQDMQMRVFLVVRDAESVVADLLSLWEARLLKRLLARRAASFILGMNRRRVNASRGRIV
jgi:hypothetical protein